MFSDTSQFLNKQKDCRAPYVFSEPYCIGLAQWFLIWGALTSHPSGTFGHAWRLLLVTSWRMAMPPASSGWDQGCCWTSPVPGTAPDSARPGPRVTCAVIEASWCPACSSLWRAILVSPLNRTQMSPQQVASLPRESRFPGCGFEKRAPCGGGGDGVGTSYRLSRVSPKIGIWHSVSARCSSTPRPGVNFR